jgi:hypothetical protein
MQNRSRDPDPDLVIYHEISWQGEWLPVELWTKVFYYMLVPMTSLAPVFSTFLAKQVEALQEHPLIAGIIEEFLLFRSGITHADAMRYGVDAGYRHFHVPRWAPIQNLDTPQCSAECTYRFRTRDGWDRFGFDTRVGEILFDPSQIHIRAGFLILDPPDDDILSDHQHEIIREVNGLLPYGMHFRFSRGDLCLFALNNPRTNPDHRFQCIRTIAVASTNELWLRLQKQVSGFDLDCDVSLNEIYVPSWRPYSHLPITKSDSENGDAKSQAET